MTIKLSRLLQDIEPLQIIGDTDRNIVSLQSDSRRAEKDGMFVAVRGVTTDGHKYIPMVGSVHVGAIVCEELPAQLVNGVTYIRVADTAETLGRLASAWYGHPSSKLKLVGVTGTNGKTTTATLLYEMARLEGYRAGLLSTVCNYVDGRAIPTTHTTPDPLTLNELLHEMVEAGCDYAFMEVSSHAAHQRRIAGLKFKGAIFSNLTRDHMDYHKTVENYRNAKKMFFDMLPEEAFALVNIDDKSGLYMTQNTRARSTPILCVPTPTSAPASSRHGSTARCCRSTARRWRCSSPDVSTPTTSRRYTEPPYSPGSTPRKCL